MEVKQNISSKSQDVIQSILSDQVGSFFLCDSDYSVVNAWSSLQQGHQFGDCLIQSPWGGESLESLFREVRLDRPAYGEVSGGHIQGWCFLAMTACPNEDALHYMLYQGTERPYCLDEHGAFDHVAFLALLESWLPILSQPAVLVDDQNQILSHNLLAGMAMPAEAKNLVEMNVDAEQLPLAINVSGRVMLLDLPKNTQRDEAEQLLRTVGYWDNYHQDGKALNYGFRELGRACDFSMVLLLEIDPSIHQLKSRSMGIWMADRRQLSEQDWLMNQIIKDIQKACPNHAEQLIQGRRLSLCSQSPLGAHTQELSQYMLIPIELNGYLKAVWILVRPLGEFFWNLTQLMRFVVLQRHLSDALRRHWDQVVADKTRTELERNVSIRTSNLSDNMVKLEREVHERIKTQKELEHTHHQLSSIIQVVPDQFYELDLKGKIHWISEGAQLPLKDSSVLDIDQSIKQIWPEELADAILIESASVSLQQEQKSFEYALEEGESTLWLEVRLMPYQQDRILLTLRDITLEVGIREGLKAKNAELVHVQRLTTLSQMMVELAHELNQPLGVIVNYANIMKRRLVTSGIKDDELDRMLEIMADQSMRASKIIRHSRHLMRRDEGEREVVKIETLIEQTSAIVSWQAGRRGVEIKILIEQDMQELSLKGIHIEQVLVNLIMNAMEACESIDQQDSNPRVEVEAWSLEDGGWHLEVRDNGPGVSEEMAKEIFHAYYTTKTEGLGMGLAISRTLIEAHGGRLWCEADHSGGRFVIELPFIE